MSDQVLPPVDQRTAAKAALVLSTFAPELQLPVFEYVIRALIRWVCGGHQPFDVRVLEGFLRVILPSVEEPV